MADTDAELVARARMGDAAAFETLVRRHFRMAYLIAFAQLNNHADAEDVCQDAFWKCWERIQDCREPERAGAWIAAIVRNHAYNRRDFLALREAEPVAAAGTVADRGRADDLALRNELRERLQNALSAISVVQREVVLLHDLEGLRHREIAIRLEISETMSRRYLSDARRRLRELMSGIPTLEADHD